MKNKAHSQDVVEQGKIYHLPLANSGTPPDQEEKVRISIYYLVVQNKLPARKFPRLSGGVRPAAAGWGVVR